MKRWTKKSPKAVLKTQLSKRYNEKSIFRFVGY